MADSRFREPVELTQAAKRHVRFSPWNLLLLVPLLAVLFPGFYNSDDPRLFEIPFFYWYQLAAIALGVACTYVVYRMTRGDR
ncbi:MAG TPA: DUF3311 domain-containing protein [Gaiellaceae bacterium]